MRYTYRQRVRQYIVYTLVLGPILGAYLMWREGWALTAAAGMVGAMLLVSPIAAASRYFMHDRWSPPSADPTRDASGARRSAEAELAAEWTLGPADIEMYSLPRGRLTTHGVAATGPGGSLLVVALSEDDTYRYLVRAIRDDDRGTSVWIPHLDRTEGRGVKGRQVETPVALPPGWEVVGVDRERFRIDQDNSTNTYGVAATAPDGRPVLAVGLTEQDAVNALQQHAQGDLAPTDHWIVRL